MTKSPCVNRCSADHPSGICQGCGRTNDQVRDWNGYTEEQKIKVIKELKR